MPPKRASKKRASTQKRRALGGGIISDAYGTIRKAPKAIKKGVNKVKKVINKAKKSKIGSTVADYFAPEYAEQIRKYENSNRLLPGPINGAGRVIRRRRVR